MGLQHFWNLCRWVQIFGSKLDNFFWRAKPLFLKIIKNLSLARCYVRKFMIAYQYKKVHKKYPTQTRTYLYMVGEMFSKKLVKILRSLVKPTRERTVTRKTREGSSRSARRCLMNAILLEQEPSFFLSGSSDSTYTASAEGANSPDEWVDG